MSDHTVPRHATRNRTLTCTPEEVRDLCGMVLQVDQTADIQNLRGKLIGRQVGIF